MSMHAAATMMIDMTPVFLQTATRFSLCGD